MRILHTMLRVGDLDKSIDFYVNRLGMNLLRKKDYPHGKFTLAFVGYGSEKENSVIELVGFIYTRHNQKKTKCIYDEGNTLVEIKTMRREGWRNTLRNIN